jgi:chemotaxis response regulator CheB
MRKKVKRQIWALIDPIQHGIIGASITHRDKLDKLRMMEYSALEAMTKGQGTIHDWRTLVDVLNLSETMARAGVGPEVLPICENAQKALHEAALRYQKTMTIGLSGEGIKAIRELIQYADLQQSSISRSEFERYIQKTKDYIKSNGNLVVEIT